LSDSKVFVTAEGFPEADGRPKFFTAAHVAELQAEIENLRTLAATEKREADERILKYPQQYVAELQFPYQWPKFEAPFWIRAVWHDSKSTYIRSDARELPALYEVVDGKPSLIEYQVENGLFRVPKILTEGYLMLGKRRASFSAH
jgi:hypothetical protein